MVVELEQRAIDARRIHVMDREGDQFAVFGEAERLTSNYVIRAKHLDRLLVENTSGYHSVADAAVAAPVVLEREVHLAPRAKKWKNSQLKSRNPPRATRIARLNIAATRVEAKRSWGLLTSEAPPQLGINVVRVFEVDPPREEPPVEWVLLTNLPIATPADIEFVVDCYRRRWLIEELFKALKSGCNYEKLQLESEKTLINALATILPIAAQMLRLRAFARSDASLPVHAIVTKNQLAALRAVVTKLPKNPTTREVLLAVAQLGGHIKNNGEPGWLVLYRGWRDLMLIEIGLQSKM
jgi:hypothetical protein